MPELTRKEFDEARVSFIKLIEIHRPHGSVRNTLTIVFDGKPGMTNVTSTSVVKVIFSQGESADDRIKSMVAKADNKKNMVVVTDDREIRYNVRAQGARLQSTAEFTAKLRTSTARANQLVKSKSPEEASGKKQISRTAEFKINKELEQVWLDKRKNKEQS